MSNSCTHTTEMDRKGKNCMGKDSIYLEKNETNEIKKTTASENYTDSNSLKQGCWMTYLNKKIWKKEFYKNDKLHGKCYEYWGNGDILETEYQNGKMHGYFSHYKPNSAHANHIQYWQNGKRLWSAFPWELDKYIVPVKGFMTEIDSVEIVVPYNSGKLMYKGVIIGKNGNFMKAIGVHKAYYESGEIKGLVDYDKNTIKVYEKNGKIIESTTISKWKGKRIK